MSRTEYSPTPENTAEQRSLKTLHYFNSTEKQSNLKELAAKGISNVKNFFNPTNIKKALRSFFQKDTIESIEPTQVVTSEQDTPINHEELPNDAIKSTKSDETSELADTHIILKSLENLESSFMLSEIMDYYRTNNMSSISSYIKSKNIPPENTALAKERILTHLAQKRIQEFKDSIATKLSDAGIPKEQFADFWTWRISNPPKNKNVLAQTDSGIEIINDSFVSDEAIQKFLSLNKKPSNQQSLKTSQDIEAIIDEMFKDFGYPNNESVKQFEETASGQLAYDIEKQSNGWIDNSMYERVANIPAGEALIMLGGINAELKPATRKLLSKMRDNLDSQDTKQTFKSFIQSTLDTTDDNPPSEKTLRSLSDIVNKLNKVAVLSEQK